jgi:hypothetical protein
MDGTLKQDDTTVSHRPYLYRTLFLDTQGPLLDQEMSE